MILTGYLVPVGWAASPEQVLCGVNWKPLRSVGSTCTPGVFIMAVCDAVSHFGTIAIVRFGSSPDAAAEAAAQRMAFAVSSA